MTRGRRSWCLHETRNASRPSSASRLIETYTRGVTREEVQRLFTHDTRDAYRFYARSVDQEALKALPRHKRWPLLGQRLFLAFSEKLHPRVARCTGQA